MKFKFIGAGQIFRPTESQQLAVLNDRAASELVRGKRGATALPLAIFGVVVVAGAIGAWVYTRPKPSVVASVPAAAATVSPEQEALDRAQKLCAGGDCEAAHEQLASIADSSPVRSSAAFRDVEGRWADQLLARGDSEQDPTRRRGLYQRVAQDMGLDAGRRKAAADKLQTLDAVAVIATATPTTLPLASATMAPPDTPVVRLDAGRRVAQAFENPPPATTAPPPLPPPTAPPTTVTVAPHPAPTSVDDKERMLALSGDQASKLAL